MAREAGTQYIGKFIVVDTPGVANPLFVMSYETDTGTAMFYDGNGHFGTWYQAFNPAMQGSNIIVTDPAMRVISVFGTRFETLETRQERALANATRKRAEWLKENPDHVANFFRPDADQ